MYGEKVVLTLHTGKTLGLLYNTATRNNLFENAQFKLKKIHWHE